MESLRRQGQSTGRRSKSIFIHHTAGTSGIIPQLYAISDVEKEGIGREVIKDILSKYFDIEIGIPLKIKDIISKIHGSQYDIKIEKVGNINYPEGMTSDITTIVHNKKSFRSKFFSNILSEGELTEKEFLDLLGLMDTKHAVTDITMEISTAANKKGYHITLIEVTKINDSPFYQRKDLMKVWISY
jgi:hypothetical protein